MNKTNYLYNLDPHQKALYEKLLKLPPSELLRGRNLTQAQTWQYQNIQNTWELITVKLIYLLANNSGERPLDPLDTPNIEKSCRQMIDATSSLLFAEFDLINKGWEKIKSAALKEKGYFPFETPTELLGDVCGYRSEKDVTDLFTEETICEVSLKKIRQELHRECGFLRNRLSPEEEQRRLSAYKDSKDWAFFAIYAIWNFRNKRKESLELVQAWERFLKAHKNFVAILCNKNFFNDKSLKTNVYIYTRDGQILLRDNRKILEGKFVNNSFIFS